MLIKKIKTSISLIWHFSWKKVAFCFCIFYFSSYSVYSQSSGDRGLPFITNFSPKDYNGHPQNWDIVQDQEGIMYFGNSLGLIEYDGVSWKPTDNEKAVTCAFVGFG